MRYAIFSDIHGNHQAWQAVLRDMEENGAEVLVCLGDAVGYGPRPRDVLASIRAHTENFVLGNHDAAACGKLDDSYFNDNARAGIELTRAQLDGESMDYLRSVPYAMEADDLLFVHAEVAMPNRFDYVISEEKAREDFEAGTHTCTFLGHTHHPVVFVQEGGRIRGQEARDFQFDSGQRYIVNVGSVGEPRDRDDLRARYVLFDDDTRSVYFRRVEFDVDGYREDLARSGAGTYPFFLQVLDEAAVPEELPAAVADMETVDVAPEEEVRIERLQLPPRISVSDASRQVARRSLRVTFFWLLVFLALAAGGWFAYQQWNPQLRAARTDPLGIAEAPSVSGTLPEPFSSDLLGYWPLDGGTSGFAGIAAFQGYGVGSLQGAPGRFGTAIRFQPDSGLTFGNARAYAIGTSALTLGFWIRLEQAPETEARLAGTGARHKNEAGWMIAAEGRHISFRVSNGTTRAQLGGIQPQLADGDWHHLVLLVNPEADRLRAFFDGEPLGELEIGALDPPFPSRHELRVGAGREGTPGFRGDLDELALWRRALTPEEIRRLSEREAPLSGADASEAPSEPAGDHGE